MSVIYDFVSHCPMFTVLMKNELFPQNLTFSWNSLGLVPIIMDCKVLLQQLLFVLSTCEVFSLHVCMLLMPQCPTDLHPYYQLNTMVE